jgi:hypothetical protein
MRPDVYLTASVIRGAQKNMTRHTMTVRKTRTITADKPIIMIILNFL